LGQGGAQESDCVLPYSPSGLLSEQAGASISPTLKGNYHEHETYCPRQSSGAMPAGQDAIALLTADHREVSDMFEQFEKLATAPRSARRN
jgi:hypothetical protein